MLCDFTVSSLPDKHPKLLFVHEGHFRMPVPYGEAQPDDTVVTKLLAPSTTICRIIERAVPYGLAEEIELQQKLLEGKRAHVSENNPVRDIIIQKIWKLGYDSAQQIC
ncbi:hypothetical protein F4777DRAFT_530669 [Nemania sp. FL0916]|nr:hypothetical protein F4777DRAFT_530669 [Nemania sp. FL0916]